MNYVGRYREKFQLSVLRYALFFMNVVLNPRPGPSVCEKLLKGRTPALPRPTHAHTHTHDTSILTNTHIYIHIRIDRQTDR